jgi:hypothetical protein
MVVSFEQKNYIGKYEFLKIRNIGNTPLVLDYVHITNNNKYLTDTSLFPLNQNLFHHYIHPWQINYEDFSDTDPSILTYTDDVTGNTGTALNSSPVDAFSYLTTQSAEDKPDHPDSVHRDPFSYHVIQDSGYFEYPQGPDITGSNHPSGYNMFANEAVYQPKLFHRPFLNCYRLYKKSRLRPYFNIDGSVSSTNDEVKFVLICRVLPSKPGKYQGEIILNYHFINSSGDRVDKKTRIFLNMSLSRTKIAEMDLTLEADIFSIENAILDAGQVVEIF